MRLEVSVVVVGYFSTTCINRPQALGLILNPRDGRLDVVSPAVSEDV